MLQVPFIAPDLAEKVLTPPLEVKNEEKRESNPGTYKWKPTLSNTGDSGKVYYYPDRGTPFRIIVTDNHYGGQLSTDSSIIPTDTVRDY